MEIESCVSVTETIFTGHRRTSEVTQFVDRVGLHDFLSAVISYVNKFASFSSDERACTKGREKLVLGASPRSRDEYRGEIWLKGLSRPHSTLTLKHACCLWLHAEFGRCIGETV